MVSDAPDAKKSVDTKLVSEKTGIKETAAGLICSLHMHQDRRRFSVLPSAG